MHFQLLELNSAAAYASPKSANKILFESGGGETYVPVHFRRNSLVVVATVGPELISGVWGLKHVTPPVLLAS